jgi:oligosaccharyltransferase complex subunit delta (ribophorin II)
MQACRNLISVFALILFLGTSLGAVNDAKKLPKKEILVDGIRFAIFNRDLNEPKEYTSLKHGDPALTKQEVDVQKKVKMQFSVKEKKTNAQTNVHQAFVVLTHADTKREIVYIAESDKISNVYTFDLDLKTRVKEFNGIGGKYAANLVLGDPQVSNPVNWHFADLVLTVPNVPSSQPNVPKSGQVNYAKLPEITYKFKEQEPRPPGIISDTFAILCAAPILVLFILWLRVGINFGNAKFSLWALGFHVGLAAIFGLYVCYWLHLNMFQTLNYLALIGLPTFVCGNRLLKSFHASATPKQKSE